MAHGDEDHSRHTGINMAPIQGRKWHPGVNIARKEYYEIQRLMLQKHWKFFARILLILTL